MMMLIIIYMAPAIIPGILLALPIWLYWMAQKFLRQRAQNVKPFVILLTALLSFAITFNIYAYQYIKTVFALSLVSSPNYYEKKEYRNDIINEAFRRSIIPPFMQTTCNKPKLVCNFSNDYILSLWDLKIDLDDIPLLAGITAAISNILFIISGKAYNIQDLLLPLLAV